jgi:hypothetical protein
LLHTVNNRLRKFSPTKSTTPWFVIKYLSWYSEFNDYLEYDSWFYLCEYIPSSQSLWAWFGGWRVHWCMEGLPALWLQLSRGQVVSHRTWGSVASDYQCSSNLTKGIPSHKNLLEWAHQDHLPKRKCTSFHISICLLYLNSFEVLLSDFNKKDTLYSLGLSSAFQNTSGVVPIASNRNYIYSPENSALYRGADKSLAWPTSWCILFDGENISFDASLAIQ